MRKEIIFAVIAGILFGAVIAFGIYRANTAITTPPEGVSHENETEEKAVEIQTSSDITLTKPENLDVLSDSPASFSGITSPNTNILISSADEDYFLTSNENGAFTIAVGLSPSINIITIAAYDDTHITQKEALTLVYSSEFFKSFLEEDTDSDTATDEADAISESVEQKLDLAKNKPTSSIGIITDITEETIQVKNADEEIQLISISDTTEYAELKKDSKDLEFEDIAIGDFMIAMGFQNGDGVLETKRILITTQPNEEEKKIYFGSITSIEKKIVTFKDDESDQVEFTFSTKWEGPEIDELVESDNYIVIANLDDDEYVIRTIEPAKREVDIPSPSPSEDE